MCKLNASLTLSLVLVSCAGCGSSVSVRALSEPIQAERLRLAVGRCRERNVDVKFAGLSESRGFDMPFVGGPSSDDFNKWRRSWTRHVTTAVASLPKGTERERCTLQVRVFGMNMFDEKRHNAALYGLLLIPAWGRRTADFWAEFRCLDAGDPVGEPVRVRIREVEIIHVSMALMPWWWSWHYRICKPAVRAALAVP